MYELPLFTLDHRFNANDAWNDKIEWKISGFSFRSDAPSGFLNLLVYPSLSIRKIEDPSSQNGWLFSPNANYRGGYYRSIRRSKIDWGRFHLPKPLLSGRLSMRSGGGLWNVQFDLESNPTRLFRHHPRSPNSDADNWLHETILSESQNIQNACGEFSLDGSDNWIPEMARYSRGGLRPNLQTKKCLRLIEEALTDTVDNALVSQTYNSERVIVRSLDKLETYWELKHDDPTRLVASYKQILRQYSKSGFSAREYRSYSDRLEKNSLCLHVSVGRGETLVIYAKTNRRVRFEIRQDFRANSSCLGGRHTATTRRAFLTLLEMARIHCATRMNHLFSYLQKNASYDVESVSTPVFLADLARSLHRSENFSDLLSLLLSNGKLQKVSGLESDLRKLSRNKIIESDGAKRSGNYVVTSKYRKALASLRRKGRSSEFGPRSR